MSRVAVLGLGSPFGDDRVGWEVAQGLGRIPWAEHGPDSVVTVDCLDRPGAGLLERFRDADCVILIDAMRSGAPAGTLRRMHPDEILADADSPSSHGFGLAQTLALGRALGELPSNLVLFGIEADAFDGPRISPALEAAMPGLVERMAGHVRDLLRGGLSANAHSA
jgi:hydrogenase maturation protease